MKNILSGFIISVLIFGTSSLSLAATETKQFPCGSLASGEKIYCSEELVVQAFEMLKKSQQSDPDSVGVLLKNGTKIGAVFSVLSALSYIWPGEGEGMMYTILGRNAGEIMLGTLGLGIAALLYSGDTEASSALDVLYSKPEGMEQLLKVSNADFKYWISVNPAIATNVMTVSAALVQYAKEANK